MQSSSNPGVVAFSPVVTCYGASSCPSTYTLSGNSCISTASTVCDYTPKTCIDVTNTITNPLPGTSGATSCQYKVEVAYNQACPEPSVLAAGNMCNVLNCLGPNHYQSFGYPGATCAEPPISCPANQHNVSDYVCAPDPLPDCTLLGAHMHNDTLDPYNCVSDPPIDCTLTPHQHNVDNYTCAMDDPVTCPAGQHNVDPWTCAIDDAPPPGDGSGDPPPGDGSGNPPPDGSGSGSGDGTGDGTGSTGDGTGSGSGTPTTCGSLACESTMLAMSGKIGDVLAAINTTRSIELAGILDTSKKMDAKTAVIAAIAQQALDYVMDLIVKETTQIAQNSDLLAKTDSLVNEIKGISNKQDLFSDKFSQKMDAMANKFDQITAKQTETNTKLDDLATKASESLQKQDTTNTKLDGIKDELGTSNTKLESLKDGVGQTNTKLGELKDGVGQGNTKLGDISSKLDNLSWLEKLGKFDALGDWFLGVIDAIKDAADVCTNHPDWLICPATPPEIDPQDLGTKEITTNVSPVISAEGSCPADRVVHLSSTGQDIHFSYSLICDFVSYLRYLVLAVSFLTAGFILTGSGGRF